HANASKQPIYLYLFEHVEPGSEEWGAFHTSEVPYALQTLDKASNRSFGAVDLAVSEMMASYWTNFVKTGDPNGKDASNWPPFRQDQPKMRVLDEHPRTEKMLNRDIRNFYERVSEGGNRLTLF
ncbi:carboxylesterase family protein, partial [Salinicola salarius]|uniref:carboxylesterase family protein n=1 Tax=Salinicola salarius TaxID=430457 RepID=UPI0026EE26D2